MTLARRRELIRSGELTLPRLVGSLLERAREMERLNAFTALLPERARETAARVQRELERRGDPPLAGTVLAVKDSIALEGERLTCASRILEDYISPYTATALQRLIDAGVVIIGKTNLDEFAMGSSGENSAFGPARNPHDPERVPGGSSSGSAVAVAAGMATAALGSDTGGSIRQPAAFCGIVGLKPTYGRVSRYGLVAFASSLDQIGILAGTADEAARILEVMAGCDPCDNTTSPQPVGNLAASLDRGVRGLRVGLPEEFGGEGVQPEIAAAIEEVAGLLRDGGAEVTACSLPHAAYAIPTYYIISSAEASSNLARYDGVRYGLKAKKGDAPPFNPPPKTPGGKHPCQSPESVGKNPDLPPPLWGGGIKGGGEDLVRRTRQAGFGDEVRRRILLGTYVLSAGYYEAYYLKAQKVRRLIREDFIKAFQSFDLLLAPISPTTAFRLGEKLDDPIAMYLSDVFSTQANLAGIPAISCPWGTDDNGLPVGVQFMAADFREDLLLAAAALLEREYARRG